MPGQPASQTPPTASLPCRHLQPLLRPGSQRLRCCCSSSSRHQTCSCWGQTQPTGRGRQAHTRRRQHQQARMQEGGECHEHTGFQSRFSRQRRHNTNTGSAQLQLHADCARGLKPYGFQTLSSTKPCAFYAPHKLTDARRRPASSSLT